MSDSKSERRERSVGFDSRVFSLAAVKKAAYRYMQAFTTDISVKENEIQCLLRFLSSTSEEGCERLADEFKKEVLDQDLREQLKIETEAVRNLILAHAFSKTKLVGDEQVSDD